MSVYVFFAVKRCVCFFFFFFLTCLKGEPSPSAILKVRKQLKKNELRDFFVVVGPNAKAETSNEKEMGRQERYIKFTSRAKTPTTPTASVIKQQRKKKTETAINSPVVHEHPFYSRCLLGNRGKTQWEGTKHRTSEGKHKPENKKKNRRKQKHK